MSAVGIQMCNGISEMPVAGMKTVCQCCPYGYHIDLDFVRFCEKMAKNSGEPSLGKRQRRERRRQRQSMEVLLGLTSPVIWKIEQLLPPIVQENSPNEVHTAPLDMSSFTYDNDGLKKAVMDFEATLERTSKKKKRFNTDPDSFERCRPDQQKLISKTNEYYKTNSSPQNTYIDLDLMTMCSSGNSSTTSPLQNIREQMAISLERMRELEEKVKSIPTLELELLTIKKEKSLLQSRLEELKKQLRTAEKNLERLREVEIKTEVVSPIRKPHMVDTGITCSAVTRDVGTAPVPKKCRDIGTETQNEVRSSLIIEKLTSTAVPSTRTMKTQAQPEIYDKSTTTDLFMKDIQEILDEKASKRLSLKDLGSLNLPRPPEKTNRGVQTITKEPVNLLLVVEKRELGVQAVEHIQTREYGVSAKPKCFDVALDVRPRLRDVGVSYDKITDVLCDRCKNLKTRTMGVGDGDVRRLEQSTDVSSLPERSKSFHFANGANQKLTRNIAVGTVAPIRKLTSTKNVDTQDFSASRIKHTGMNTHHLQLVDTCVGNDSVLTASDSFICSKCSNEAKVPAKHVNTPKESRDSQHKDVQPSKIPRPKSLNTTPIMERKKFVRQDTYTKSFFSRSPTSESPKKSKPRVNLSSDKSEDLAEEKVEVTRRNKTKAKEQPVVEPEQLHKDLKELQLEEGTERYSRNFDDYCYDYDESYGDQDSKRNSQLFPENVLFQPIQDEPREKIKPSKEMKAAMKVVNDSLSKYPGGLPRHLKNASNILQQEWFKISSTASANPLDVEDYLDSFEEVSNTLLEYVVNMVDNNGNTAMHYAVSHGNFDVVSILLDSKVCNINKANAAGYTCIMLVSLAQVRSETHRQVVRRLFQLADVNIRAKQHGQTALMLAVSHGRLDMVKLLLEAGADPNIQDGDGSTALMCAAEHGHTEIVKQLLAHPDCDPSIVDCDGSTALAIAMEAGNRDIGVLLYAREHFASGSRGSSPYTSIRQRRSKTSSSPHCRTPTSPNPNRKSDHSL